MMVANDATKMLDRPMFGNLLSASMMDDSGTTAMKFALVAVLLVLAVYQG
jgi:Flp pilus assembly protein TadG